ncbi:MAG TPA: TIGR00730 family Rossman fold protein [Candidatus Deferrimicrobiaceae bacterium]
MKIERLCVFCSSSNFVPDALKRDAAAMGDRMADRGIAMVYGGGSVGLMGILADRILERGGKVIGVIPSFLSTKELAHDRLTRMIVTGSMHERKMEMSRMADAFAVLPGGFGTMDEFFEILTWKQLGLHDRPIVVANAGGWFSPILSICRKAAALKTIAARNAGLFQVVATAADVVPALSRKGAAVPHRRRLSRV